MPTWEKADARRWVFSVTDCNGDEFYLDENGKEADQSDAKEHVATDTDAATEGDRRADLWEKEQSAVALKITRHAKGKATK